MSKRSIPADQLELNFGDFDTEAPDVPETPLSLPSPAPARMDPFKLTDDQRQALDLRFNRVLSASAGTGKTHTLTAFYLGLLAGRLTPGGALLSEDAWLAAAREESFAPLAPSAVVAVTFMEKAAAELLERTRVALESLQLRPDLPPRLQRHLELCRDELPSAPVSTTHAFCARLLREAGARSAAPAGFEMLETDAASALLERALTEVAAEILEAGTDPSFKAIAVMHSAGSANAPKAVELTAQSSERAEDNAVRPFRAHIAQTEIEELRRRIRDTRWSDKETIADASQGLRLAELQGIVRHWGKGYDWRKAEAKLNSYPQFTTKIDGLDIHFIHVRSRHRNALPVVITHGWPGSVFELIKVVGPLTDPTAHGGRAEDAFDVVIPSMPGYGFSGKPTAAGWGADRIGHAWAVLMGRIGYSRYVSQGGDWGAAVAGAMARQAPAGLIGIHVNLPAAQPPEVAAAIASGAPAPAGMSVKEQDAFDALKFFFQKNRAYAAIMATKPQVIGASLTDSPAGLAAFMLDYNGQEPVRLLNRDDVLDSITLHWLTNSATSAARLYWEEGGRSVTNSVAQKTREISLPVAVTVFPHEVYRAPETWVRRAYPNLVYFNEVDRGGHFAAWEQPQLFAEELRAAFRTLR